MALPCYSLFTRAINCKAFLSRGTTLHRALCRRSPTGKNNPVAGVWQKGAITDALMGRASWEQRHRSCPRHPSCPGQRAHGDAGSGERPMPMPQRRPLAPSHHTDQPSPRHTAGAGRDISPPSPPIDKTMFCYELGFTAQKNLPAPLSMLQRSRKLITVNCAPVGVRNYQQQRLLNNPINLNYFITIFCPIIMRTKRTQNISQLKA